MQIETGPQMGILQILTVSISELTPKFQCKNCLYPPGSVEHTTRWLLSLLPCQAAVNQSLTFCSDMVPWEPHEGPAQWPFRWAPAKLPMVSRRPCAWVTLLRPNLLCQSWHGNSSSQRISLTMPWGTCSTPQPSLPLLARLIYLPGQKEEGMKLLTCGSTGISCIPQYSAAPALPSSSSAPRHSFRRLDGPNGFRRNPTL